MNVAQWVTVVASLGSIVLSVLTVLRIRRANR